MSQAPNNIAANSRLDRVGASASLICAIHCALMPFLVAFLPVLGLSFLAHDYVEWLFVGLSTAIGLASLLLGYRVHGQRRALASLSAGVALLVIGRIAEYRGGLSWGVPCLVVGALVIAASHLLNAKLCRTCVRCKEHGCDGSSS